MVKKKNLYLYLINIKKLIKNNDEDYKNHFFINQNVC